MEEPSLLLCDPRVLWVIFPCVLSPFPSPLLLCSCHQLCSCAVAGEKRGVRESPWGLDQALGCSGEEGEEEVPGTAASPRCPAWCWLPALSQLPARAAVRCWRLGHAINQKLLVPFD